MARARLINARDMIYITVSRSGARLIGGSLNYLADHDEYVVYHSGYPDIRISFSPFRDGEVRSRIRKRDGATWQSALPVSRLGFPDGFETSAAQTLQKASFDDDNVVTLDLRAAPVNEPGALRQDPLVEASQLLERLGALIVENDDLADRIVAEFGIRISFIRDT